MNDMINNKENRFTHENLFEIMDNVILQIDYSKKVIIIMIVTFFVIPPISANIIGITNPNLEVIMPIVLGVVSLVWLGVGIRQWITLSKWTQKYRRYKELQKIIEERLDFEKGVDKK